jgi:hypothetical protein
MLVAGLLLILASVVQGQDYVYTDDYSTDKAMTDSYEHSELYEQPPDPWPLTGFFVYETIAGSDVLAFYGGTANDAWAQMRYSFPVDGELTQIADGWIEFDISDNQGDMGSVRVLRSFDGGASWELYAWVGAVGHHWFDLTPSYECDCIHVMLSGMDVRLDNLTVSLTYVTPADAATWAGIKELYR